MPRIFDNIDAPLLPALRQALEASDRADFSVGYFNLRGWRGLAPLVDRWAGGGGACCRLLVGMHRPPEESLKHLLGAGPADGIDNQTANRERKRVAQAFADQLQIGAPTNDDERGLRLLAAQLRAKKLVVKLFLAHPLHAKLYLTYRQDFNNPVTGFVGSSNLTLAGLAGQGELNVDVVDHDACRKLVGWFEERWGDRWCVDISADLAQIIDESWARERPIPPYHIYVKIAYHLSQEARAGLAEFKIPKDLDGRLSAFQKEAVKVAARHLNRRGGVLIGDVVGLGKTRTAATLARIFEDDFGYETLILCPKNLVPMWERHRERYGLRGRVLSMSLVGRELTTDFPRYRLVIIDESHNLRNREGRRYQAIHEYLLKNDSRCILLSATPYNKGFLDLASQLKLFVADDQDLGVRPEHLIRELGGEAEFVRRHQCGLRTLAAFEKSENVDDWRDLMRLYLVRRTRTFIQEMYAETDPADGRKYLTLDDGRRSYFPRRVPRTVPFRIDDADPADQYARLYAAPVVDALNRLTLPRYGLANYVDPSRDDPPTPAETRVYQNLSKAGHRLKGFCRTNLLKRLESSGQSFLQSIERHLLRNFVYLHALSHKLPVPIGTQGAELLDPQQDDDEPLFTGGDDGDDDAPAPDPATGATAESELIARAAEVYKLYAGPFKTRFKWVRAGQFTKGLARDLKKDNAELLGVLQAAGPWDPARDAKLNALSELLTDKHPGQKVLLFSQFADTVRYLSAQLAARGVGRLAAATGDTPDPTDLVHRFSPVSNEVRAKVPPARELDVLLATDVLSEGQNLQDASIVVNYDLPWAIIRLVQRAGRVDRLGQAADTVQCYSFLPADGVERLLRLRDRVRQRLRENAEVVGTDEEFFEGDGGGPTVRDLYTEKAGVLDGDADDEVDLGSYAYQVWKQATDADPKLRKAVEALPSVVYSAKAHVTTPDGPPGVLVYSRTADGTDALAWVGADGRSVTESQLAILKAAACNPPDPALDRADNHHELVKLAVDRIAAEVRSPGGQLGRPSGARYKVYDRLARYADTLRGTLLDSPSLKAAVEQVYRFPLRPAAADKLNRQLKAGVTDIDLAALVTNLWEDEELCQVAADEAPAEAQIICSLGLVVP